MKIVLSLLNEFVELTEAPEKIAEILTKLGLEVEEVTYWDSKYKNFVVGKVIECKQLNVESRLSLCKVDVGSNVKTIVCGASNVATGQNVVVALPGAILPNRLLKIEPKDFGNVRSEGMICSESELGIGDDAGGILVLPSDAVAGSDFTEYFGLDDVVFEIGITPNRADCLSHLGVARELSAYLGKKLHFPKIELKEESEENIEGLISVEVLDSEKCPRYTARVIKDVQITESPRWLKNYLIMMGLRPINTIVDVTNYVMMELGQPLHAFDYDRLSGKRIIVRTASEGEKFTSIDGKERILDSSMLMICDTEKPVAIGGVMGGENSEISSTTRNVLLESAFFLPSSIRRTSKKLSLSSESSYRFERGVDISNVPVALDRAAHLIAKLSNGVLVKGKVDSYPSKLERKKIDFRFERARSVIGVDIPNSRMNEILSSLGFDSVETGIEKTTFAVPFHRVDVSLEIDLIEEVARFYGYNNVPEDTSYSITYEGEKIGENLSVPKLRNQIREYFIARGFTEFLTPNLYSPQKAKLVIENDFIELSNPLGEELSIMRPSIVPPILEAIGYNLRVGKSDLRILEVGKIFCKTANRTKFIEGIEEREVFAIALVGNAYPLQWGMPNRKVDFFDIKGVVQDFIMQFRISSYVFEKLPNSKVYTSEAMTLAIDGKKFCEFGGISKKLLKEFDIEENVFLALFDLDFLYGLKEQTVKYEKISPYPVVRRDLAFVFDEQTPIENIENIIQSKGGPELRRTVLFDVYRGKNLGEGKKSLAFALYFNSFERTLTDEEIDTWINNIVEGIKIKLNGQLRVF